jgi:hypothetical protein
LKINSLAEPEIIADTTKADDLTNKINRLDKATFYTQATAAFLVAALQGVKQGIGGENTHNTLNQTLTYLSIGIPLVTTFVTTILTKERNDAIEAKKSLVM